MESVLGNLSRGLLFVVSAPAGTGKTTLTQKLVREFPCVVQSISYTTRKPREGEIDGIHYNFITNDDFHEKIEDGEFLEYAKIYDHYYGTSKKWVEEQLTQGKHVVLVIETQGGNILREKCDAKYIFILPPSLEELGRRLRARSSESKEALEKRIAWAKNEIEGGKNYDYHIINHDLQIAYDIYRSLFIAEEHRTINQNYQGV